MALYFCGEKHRITSNGNLDNQSGGVSNIPSEPKSVTYRDNGTYTVTPDPGKTLSEVNVTVDVVTPVPLPALNELIATENKTYTPDGFDGYYSVTVNVPTITATELNDVEIKENGTHVLEADEGYAFSKITLNIDVSPEEVSNSFIVASGSCGANVEYELYENGLLYIKGTGSTTNYNSNLLNSPLTALKSNIKYAIIQDGITSIGDALFSSCTNLSHVYIPNSLKVVGKYAFYKCGITSLFLPDSVTSIGESCFLLCTSLVNITLSKNITSIPSSAFSNCRCIINITIPNDVKTIYSSAFNDCNALESIIIPDNVTEIQKQTFRYCYNLKTIDIPNGLTSIGNNAFAETSLDTIYYNGSQEDWNKITISSGNDKLLNANKYSKQIILTQI